MKDRIDKFLQGEDYRAMYLKVRDELAQLQQSKEYERGYTDAMNWKVQNYLEHLPPQEERNFCSRCGKRTADLTVIHTCTPPKETP